MRTTEIRRDCVSWDEATCTCRALKEIVCAKKECSFCKTAEQAQAERERAEERLSKIAVGHADEMPGSVSASLAVAGEKPTLIYRKAKREKKAEYLRERRKTLVRQGMCPSCGKKNDRPDKSRCTACVERELAKKKAKAYILREKQW